MRPVSANTLLSRLQIWEQVRQVLQEQTRAAPRHEPRGPRDAQRRRRTLQNRQTQHEAQREAQTAEPEPAGRREDPERGAGRDEPRRRGEDGERPDRRRESQEDQEPAEEAAAGGGAPAEGGLWRAEDPQQGAAGQTEPRSGFTRGAEAAGGRSVSVLYIMKKHGGVWRSGL